MKVEFTFVTEISALSSLWSPYVVIA